MTRNGSWIGNVLVRIQDGFLDDPALTLSAAQAASRSGVDRTACEGILAALAASGVLARTSEGAYVRFLPRLVGEGHCGILWDGPRHAA